MLIELEGTDAWQSAAEESKHQYAQAQAAYQTVTGATVHDDRTKAEADVKASQQMLDAAKKDHENRVTFWEKGRRALAPKCKRRSRSDGAGAEPVR